MFYQMLVLLGLPLLHLSALTWSSPIDISDSVSNIEEPQVCLDSSNNAVVVWSGLDQNYEKVVQATYYNGNTWSPIVNVFPNVGSYLYPAKLAGNLAGRAIAVASLRTGGVSVAHAAVCDSGTWSSPVAISTGSGDTKEPQIAINSSGNGVAVWNQVESAKWNVKAAFFSSGVWTTPESVSSDITSTYSACGVIGSGSNGLALWYTVGSTYYVIKASNYVSNWFFPDAWAAPQVISNPAQNVFSPHIAMNESNLAVATWMSLTGPSWNIASSYWENGTWSTPVIISTIGRNDMSPHVSINSDGTAVAVWLRRTSRALQVYASTFSNGTWSEPVQISSEEAGDAGIPKVAIADSGNAIAVWSDGTGIHSASYMSGTWSDPELISEGIGIFSDVSVAVNDQDEIMVIWKKSNIDVEVIQSASSSFALQG